MIDERQHTGADAAIPAAVTMEQADANLATSLPRSGQSTA